MFKGRTFDETKVGERFSDTITVTETHLVLAASLFKDFNPLHANEEYAKTTIFKGRVVHGPLTAGIMAGVLGNYFAGTAIAYLEQTTKFLSPVRPGETLTTEWKVMRKEPKAKYNGGVITLEAKCKNQYRKTVAEGTGKILVSNAHGLHLDTC